MKRFASILLFSTCIPLLCFSQYASFFSEGSLRFDLLLSGNATETRAAVFELKKESYYGGTVHKTIDPFNYGEFKVTVTDPVSNKRIYTRGFCTLFEEWQTTDEAYEMERGFFQTLTIPFPKNEVRVLFERRNKGGEFYTLVEMDVNPMEYGIVQSSIKNTKTHKIIDNGTKDECVDIVIIGDGYTQEEMVKFHEDVRRMSDYMFSQEPFATYKRKFNIWAVDAISEESGVSDPRKGIWKHTALKSSFNTLNSDRYLTSTHNFLIRDYAALVPYDQIYVIANTDKYGGGGIYNHFSLTSIDNPRSLPVFIHEFGHAFAGLGDEYYTSDVSYSDFFNLAIEPWQPNLTTLKDFDSKWKDMLAKSIPVPTPAQEKYFKEVGVFEGGGYVSKGIYRPWYDCRMKSNEATAFCPVCQRAIKNMILFLTDN
ncbi:Peptidase M64 N-terminus [Saccharicrinis carchari]|uniref:Peptidase M64 N-terminus n=1 Tax=Saccharicrinis carchari TaxID=1168039 RepID=A0A521ELB3_SACCC|nr:M64 family metallopeptidase [Saccharicrinis carchari]SMO84697.1 Peptidase M64 N-terminus [Saccharicrinis carchari]